MNRKHTFLQHLLVLGALAGCATAITPELRDARAAFARANSGEAPQLVPAELHKAHEALEQAESAFRKDPDGYHAKDLAYVAQRKAEMAEAMANIAEQATAKAKADKDYLATTDQMMHQTKDQLKQTQDQLTTSKADAAKTAEQLAMEQEARMKAEKKTAETMEALSKLAAVKEEERGLVITLSGSVLFRSGEAVLLPEARVRLDQVSDALLQTKERKLVIEGHTDSKGSVDHNLELSKRRAEAVRDYLATRGYPTDKMTAEGIGSARPVADNKTAEGRANNRRVEIIVKPASDVSQQ